MPYEYHHRFGGCSVVRLSDLRDALPREVLGERDLYECLDSTRNDTLPGSWDRLAAVSVHADRVRLPKPVAIHATLEPIARPGSRAKRFNYPSYLGWLLPQYACIQLWDVRARIRSPVVSGLLASQPR